MVVRPGRQGEKHIALCGASRNGVAPCGVIHQRGAGKRSATKELPGRILEPTSCLPAMK